MIREAGEVLGFEPKRSATARWLGILVLGMCLTLLLVGGRSAMAEEKTALLKDVSLVESGQATLDEKLAVVKQLLAVNEYARLETLVTGDAERRCTDQ